MRTLGVISASLLLLSVLAIHSNAQFVWNKSVENNVTGSIIEKTYDPEDPLFVSGRLVQPSHGTACDDGPFVTDEACAYAIVTVNGRREGDGGNRLFRFWFTRHGPLSLATARHEC